MSDEVRLDSEEMRKLGTAFELHAYDLGRHLSAFRARTDAEALRHGFGGTAESSYSGLSELSAQAGLVIGRLQERLDEIGSGMKAGAMNSEAAEEGIAELIRGLQ